MNSYVWGVRPQQTVYCNDEAPEAGTGRKSGADPDTLR
jgi:hypothetical protein